MGHYAGLECSTGGKVVVEQLLALRDVIQRSKERAPLPIPTFGELKQRAAGRFARHIARHML
jgi:hypothetical protein